jgi:hypothetical protein
MTKRKVSAVEADLGYPTDSDQSRRGMGLFAKIAILSILGIVIWLIVSNNDETQ